jgi:hypothetical protein
MRTTVITAVFCATAAAALVFLFHSASPIRAEVPPGPSAGAPPPRPAPASSPPDTAAAERDSLMNEVLRSIDGHENAPAESVFKNIRMMKGIPAGRLLRIMNVGYGRSLGASCTHCHVAGEWDKEDKPQKQVARDMAAMMQSINRELLPKIRNLESKEPVVNCTTCHRGAIKPALNL